MQQKLNELRAQLDAINGELAVLLEKRFEITDEIGALKRDHSAPVRDRARELAILEKVTGELHDPDKAEDVGAVFEAVFAASRRRQERIKG